ncbi:hypothetical protein [Streptomyces sp. NPDC020747]|uniref:hypothetical protein n=1 Tax=Streptomyces sp. NPDC020747 TaxID=3365086 RepID=UPI003797E690
MTFPVAAVVLVGLLCLLDLLLTFAAPRRLREHSAEPGRPRAQPAFKMYDPQTLAGTTTPELAGESEARLVTFLDANRDSCHDHAPVFPPFLLVQADGTITQAMTEPGTLAQPVPTT